MGKKSTKLSYHMRIVALLSDGAFHSFMEIHKAVGKHVDAEVADREYRKRHKDWARTKVAERVAAGRKRLVFLSLNSMHHHRKMVEVGKGRAEERLYRLTKSALKARNSKPGTTKTTAQKTKAARESAKPATRTAAKRTHKNAVPLPSQEATRATTQEVKP